MEQIALLVGEHIPRVIPPDLVHGPPRICRTAVLGRENNSAETRCGEAVVLGCADSTRITTTAVVLTEIAVLGCQIETSAGHCATLYTGADIEVLPFLEFGSACLTGVDSQRRRGMGIVPCSVKMII